MTEAEWLQCEEPERMLPELLPSITSVRKLPLLACACCRRLPVGWYVRNYGGSIFLSTPASDEASRIIAAAERFAEGEAFHDGVRVLGPALVQALDWAQAGLDEQTAAPEEDVWDDMAYGGHGGFVPYRESRQCRRAADARIEIAAGRTLLAVTGANEEEDREVWESEPGAVAQVAIRSVVQFGDGPHGGATRAQVCDLIRDIFGIPGHVPAILSSWLTPTVVALAWAAKDARVLPVGEMDCDRLAVLSDALQEAGCTDGEVLAHLRGPGPHVLGCWVLDLLLGQE